MMLVSSSTSCCEEPSVALSGFTEDIWLEIFSHLPLKFIFKFKCVSKVWSVLLSDPYFIYKWITLNNSNTSRLPWTSFFGFIPPKDYLPNNPMTNIFSNAYLELHSPFFSSHTGFTFEFLNPDTNYPDSSLDQGKYGLYLLGSSNGLVLCSRTTDYYVCNPLTQKWVTLPPPPSPGRKRIDVATGFECEVLSSSLLPTRYTVVRIPKFEGDSNKFNVEVFSSVSSEWNIFEVSCPQVVAWRGNNHNGLLIRHGVMHWIEGKKRILVYNVDSNNNNAKTGGRQCRLINLPDDTLWLLGQQGIWESEGLFCYASIQRTYPTRTLSVWVLERELHILHKRIELDDHFIKIANALHDILAQIYPDSENDLLPDLLATAIHILGFFPGDKNTVLFGYCSYVWAFNIQTEKTEELCRPSFLPSFLGSECIFSPAVLKTMPTILPPPS